MLLIGSVHGLSRVVIHLATFYMFSTHSSILVKGQEHKVDYFPPIGDSHWQNVQMKLNLDYLVMDEVRRDEKVKVWHLGPWIQNELQANDAPYRWCSTIASYVNWQLCRLSQKASCQGLTHRDPYLYNSSVWKNRVRINSLLLNLNMKA